MNTEKLTTEQESLKRLIQDSERISSETNLSSFKKLKIAPLGDRVIIKPSEPETKTSTGLLLVGSAVEKPNQGQIVAIGNGRYNEQKGETVPLSVRPGDNVLYGKYGATEIQYEGETLLIMRESDLLAII